MTVGSIVEHWAHGLGIILAIDTVAGMPAFVKVHWNEPVEFEDDGEDVVQHEYWTNHDEVTVISEAR